MSRPTGRSVAGLRRAARRPEAGARGASAVEFALVVPLVLMLVLGVFSGGLAYNRKIAITDASREAVRFGATLPTGKSGVADSWLDQVADRARLSASGELDLVTPGRYTCVAYVGYGSPEGTTVDSTRKREQNGSGSPTYTSGSVSAPGTWCFDDGRGANGSERRIQVLARRTSDLNALLFSMTLTLRADAVARYEAVSPP